MRQGTCQLDSSYAPDLVLINGKIATVNDSLGIAEAVAAKGGTIVAVGSSEEIRPSIAETTRVLDLGGRTTLPGIVDSHLHLGAFAVTRPPLSLDLRFPGVQSISDIARLLAQKADETPPGTWITGNGWDAAYLSECATDPERLPTRHDLDAASPEHPVCLYDFTGGHFAWVNTPALRLAGIEKGVPDPIGGTIHRDGTGTPTGLLEEMAATSMVSRLIPPRTEQEIRTGVLAALAELASQGITSVTDAGVGPGGGTEMGGAMRNDVIGVYNGLHREGLLTARVSILLLFAPLLTMGSFSLARMKDYLSQVATNTGFGDEWLKIAGLKLTADSMPPNKTAWMHDEYIGGGHGSLIVAGADDDERYRELVDMIVYASRRRFQVGIHATGDRTIDACVDGFVRALDEDPWDARHYTIHSDFTTPACARRMAAYGIGANVESHVKWIIADHMDTVVGPERSAYQWPLRTLIDAGVHVANSSDAPLVYPDWRVSVQAAVTRESRASGRVSGPDQRISVAEAIRTWTIEGAWLDHADHRKGSIEVGKVADFCVLDRDILSIDVHDIHKVKNLLTVAGGEVIYNAAPDKLVVKRCGHPDKVSES